MSKPRKPANGSERQPLRRQQALFRPSQASLGSMNLMRRRQILVEQNGPIFVIRASGSGLRPARGQAETGINVQSGRLPAGATRRMVMSAGTDISRRAEARTCRADRPRSPLDPLPTRRCLPPGGFPPSAARRSRSRCRYTRDPIGDLLVRIVRVPSMGAVRASESSSFHRLPGLEPLVVSASSEESFTSIYQSMPAC